LKLPLKIGLVFCNPHFSIVIEHGRGATRRHVLGFNSPLKVDLTVTENKTQLIDLICQTLQEDALKWSGNTKLVLAGRDPMPVEIASGKAFVRDDLGTTHEEADVIMVYQVLHLVSSGKCNIRVLCDDTDVFVVFD
jgi:hypothetical protein